MISPIRTSVAREYDSLFLFWNIEIGDIYSYLTCHRIDQEKIEFLYIYIYIFSSSSFYFLYTWRRASAWPAAAASQLITYSNVVRWRPTTHTHRKLGAKGKRNNHQKRGTRDRTERKIKRRAGDLATISSQQHKCNRYIYIYIYKLLLYIRIRSRQDSRG